VKVLHCHELNNEAIIISDLVENAINESVEIMTNSIPIIFDLKHKLDIVMNGEHTEIS
jgi:hypothetical protein